MPENKLKEEQKTDSSYVFERHEKSDPFGALFLIFLGIIFLLNNFGIISWSVWSQIWRLWPILLVFAGVNLIFGRNFIGRLIMFILGLAFFGFIFWKLIIGDENFFQNPLGVRNRSELRQRIENEIEEEKTEDFRVKQNEFKGVEKRNLKMDLGAGTFYLSESGNDYFNASATFGSDSSRPELTAGMSENILDINFKSERPDFTFFNRSKQGATISIGKPEIETDVDINLGAGVLNSDFGNLNLNNAKINVGAGRANFNLTNSQKPSGLFDINLGAGEFNLSIPNGSPYEIDYSIGLGVMEINGRDLHGKGVFKSDESGETEYKIKISVGAGKANITSK